MTFIFTAFMAGFEYFKFKSEIYGCKPVKSDVATMKQNNGSATRAMFA